MVAVRIIDAKQECLDNVLCNMFYANKYGYPFYWCEVTSTVLPSRAGDVLYKKGNTHRFVICYVLDYILST